VLVVFALAIFGMTAVPAIVDEFRRLITNLQHYVETSRQKLGPVVDRLLDATPFAGLLHQDIDHLFASAPDLVASINGESVKRVLNAVGGTLLQGYSKALTLVNIALLPFIVYYLAVDLPRLHAFFLGIFPLTKRAKVESIVSEIDTYVSAFVRGQAIVCCVLFVLYSFGLWLVGVDLWLLLAAISGFGNIIPYVGFLTGIVLSSVMALVTFGDVSHMLYVWGVYAAVQALEGTFITPKILGDSVGLSPLVIILALFVGGQLFGLLGIFLAVPAAAALRVLARSSYEWVMDR
jgi:predicted PurR-regulated permease PerM